MQAHIYPEDYKPHLDQLPPITLRDHVLGVILEHTRYPEFDMPEGIYINRVSIATTSPNTIYLRVYKLNGLKINHYPDIKNYEVLVNTNSTWIKLDSPLEKQFTSTDTEGHDEPEKPKNTKEEETLPWLATASALLIFLIPIAFVLATSSAYPDDSIGAAVYILNDLTEPLIDLFGISLGLGIAIGIVKMLIK